MAKSTLVQSTVQISYRIGQSAAGKDIIKNQKFSKVKVTALDDDVFTVATALGTLLNYPVQGIVRLDNNLITNQ